MKIFLRWRCGINTIRILITKCIRCGRLRNDVGHWEEKSGLSLEYNNVAFGDGICEVCSTKAISQFDVMREIVDASLQSVLN
ncbi:MAG TPA: hypothetical protein VK452_01600 [Dissulfurispiraceae bacterium]|nr:hypothetical protein [Dissulfurispiraceae bacterium]